jgi:dihydropteroate synthase
LSRFALEAGSDRLIAMTRTALDDLVMAPGTSFWLRPLGMARGAVAHAAIAAGDALPLLGETGRGFLLVEIIIRDAGTESGMRGRAVRLAEGRRWAAAHDAAERFAAQLDALTQPRPRWAGLDLGAPRIMGIVNVTPDSFSESGAHRRADAAIAHGKALLASGADLLDIGGESTRPGAAPVGAAEEIRRVEPVIRALADLGAVISIDTRHAATMAAALAAGARIINDVTALTGDPASLAVAARSGAPLILMHMPGEPPTMQESAVYESAPLEVLDYLLGRVAACEAAGIPRSRIVVDPGIGFGKRLRHNLQILARLSLLHLTGCPILLGASRKSLIASRVDPGIAPRDRLPGSLVAALAAIDQGVQILRVHDVAQTWQAIEVWRGIVGAG